MERGKKLVIVEKEEEKLRRVNDVDKYIRSFPPGHWFKPTDSELIVDYLMNKVFNKPLPNNRIRDVNLYDYHPQQLTDMHRRLREKAWYFFTKRKRRHVNGNRPDRSAGDGYWKATGANIPIFSNEEIVGFKKAMVYFEERSKDGGSEKKSIWLMHEYRLKEECNTTANPSTTTPDDMKLDGWILCKVYHKRKSKQQQDDADQYHHQQQGGGEEVIPINQEWLPNAYNQDHPQPSRHGSQASPPPPLPSYGIMNNNNMYAFGLDGAADNHVSDHDDNFSCLSLGDLSAFDPNVAPNMLFDFHYLDFILSDDDNLPGFHGKG